MKLPLQAISEMRTLGIHAAIKWLESRLVAMETWCDVDSLQKEVGGHCVPSLSLLLASLLLPHPSLVSGGMTELARDIKSNNWHLLKFFDLSHWQPDETRAFGLKVLWVIFPILIQQKTKHHIGLSNKVPLWSHYINTSKKGFKRSNLKLKLFIF